MPDSTPKGGVSIRPRRPDDDPRLLEIFAQTEDTFHMTLESFRYHFDGRVREAGKKPVCMLAEIGGHVVGDWYLEPHHSGEIGVFFAFVEVDQAEQGKGYGSILWRDLESALKERTVRRAYAYIRDDLERSKEFAAKRHFTLTGHGDRMSRLDLATANLDGYDGIEDHMAEIGVSIVGIAEMDTSDETFMRQLYDATNSMMADIPRTEENWEPAPYDIWRQNFMKSPDLIPDAYFVALKQGKPVGMANLMKNGDMSVANGLTGVVPSERHQGIARALKFRTIQWSKEHGKRDIVTANDLQNAPMLSINIPLGYKAVPAREEWVKRYEG